MKHCRKCQTDKDETEFSKNQAYCKACNRAYRQTHAEQIRETNRRYQRGHPEKLREFRTRYYSTHKLQERRRHQRTYDENREAILARNRAWREANPDKCLEYSRQRQRRERRFLGGLTTQDCRTVLRAADGRCYYCGEHRVLHLEHKTPLSRGGTHTVENLVASCPRCNWVKGQLTEAEFWAEVEAGHTILR